MTPWPPAQSGDRPVPQPSWSRRCRAPSPSACPASPGSGRRPWWPSTESPPSSKKSSSIPITPTPSSSADDRGQRLLHSGGRRTAIATGSRRRPLHRAACAAAATVGLAAEANGMWSTSSKWRGIMCGGTCSATAVRSRATIEGRVFDADQRGQHVGAAFAGGGDDCLRRQPARRAIRCNAASTSPSSMR